MRYNNKKKYIIEKQDTTTTTNNTSDYYNNTTTDDVYTDDYDEYYSETEDVTSTVNQTTSMQKTTNEERVVYNSIMNTGYKKPKSGSKQDNFTKEEILKKLESLPKYKSPGIGIDIQGKQRDKYKIRVSGARNKEQLDRIIGFMNILIFLYLNVHQIL